MEGKLTDFDKEMIKKSIELAIANVEKGGEPFGAVLTKNQEIITEAVNEAYINQDPTAHAEMQAIRQSGETLNLPRDSDITMYASGKPCGMCMAAMLQVKITRVVFAADEELGEVYGWGTQPLYDSLKKDFGQQGIEVINCPDPKSKEAFVAYDNKHKA
ncbi:nucleoside deaminase [Psychrobacter frigidicola]|uniref:Nucleoside deaminase n=1 Tax=Psychrobacter frigidicola TaxID=45611 RepID=A0A5C7A9Y2_9GAMM|nr:nucleoside deaminase [Psychrobacter frigidicola]TXD98476.1 nucleoside deaminase [Psychrobacter frigidicola]